VGNFITIGVCFLLMIQLRYGIWFGIIVVGGTGVTIFSGIFFYYGVNVHWNIVIDDSICLLQCLVFVRFCYGRLVH